MTKQEAIKQAEDHLATAENVTMVENRQSYATLALAYATLALSLPENVSTARPFTDATQR